MSPVVISLTNKVQPQRPHTSITLRSHLFMKNFTSGTKNILEKHEKSQLAQKLNRNLSDDNDAIKKFENIWSPRPNSRIRSPRRLGNLSQEKDQSSHQSDSVIPEKLPMHHSHSVALNSLIIKIPRPKTTSAILPSAKSELPLVPSSQLNRKNQHQRPRPQTVDGVSATRMKSIRAQRLKFLYDEPLRRHSVKAVQEVEDNIRLEHTIKQPVIPGEPLPPKHGMDHHRPWIAYLHSSNYNKSADVNQVLDNNESVSRESTPILGHYVDKFYKVKEGEQILLGSLDQTDGYHIGINGHQSKLRHSHSMIPTENSNKKAPVWQPLSIDELISHSPPSHVKDVKIQEKPKKNIQNGHQDESSTKSSEQKEKEVIQTSKSKYRRSQPSPKVGNQVNRNRTQQNRDVRKYQQITSPSPSPVMTPKEAESKTFNISYSSRSKKHSPIQNVTDNTLEINNNLVTVSDHGMVVSSIMKGQGDRHRPRSNYSVQFRLPNQDEQSTDQEL